MRSSIGAKNRHPYQEEILDHCREPYYSHELGCVHWIKVISSGIGVSKGS